MEPDKIYLAQTDTTVGFLSQDSAKLAAIKKRPPSKPFLVSVDSFARLQGFARVPKRFRRFVRYARKTTFIYPNAKAVRVVRDERHLSFLKKFGWMYSTSANESGKRFDPSFAKAKADVIVEDSRGLFEGAPSKLLRLGRRRLRRVR